MTDLKSENSFVLLSPSLVFYCISHLVFSLSFCCQQISLDLCLDSASYSTWFFWGISSPPVAVAGFESLSPRFSYCFLHQAVTVNANTLGMVQWTITAFRDKLLFFSLWATWINKTGNQKKQWKTSYTVSSCASNQLCQVWIFQDYTKINLSFYSSSLLSTVHSHFYFSLLPNCDATPLQCHTADQWNYPG